mgnify:CR=1 FL=1
MKFGPFDIQIASEALILDYELLSEEEKKSLFKGVRFDDVRHGIYKIGIVPVRKQNHNYKGKTLRKKSLEKVDRLFVDMEFPDQASLIGCMPISSPPLEAENRNTRIEFEITTSTKDGISLTLKGEVKNLFRKNKQAIIAHSIHPNARWIFAKNMVRSANQFDLIVSCAIPEQTDSVFCKVHASMKDGGRLIESIKQEVSLPNGS